MPISRIFPSFFMAGFECSSHRRSDGLRLDLIRSTGHEGCTLEDYRACAGLDLLTVRDGLRWHLIESEPGRYDWSSWLPMVEAAEDAGVRIIWDLCHYGFPDHLTLGSDEFIAAFAAFAAEAVRVHRSVTGRAPLVCPMNEISYFTWAVNTGYFPRLEQEKRGWLKQRLVQAALGAAGAVRAAEPDTRFFWAEPLINILPRSSAPEDIQSAEGLRLAQFEAYDMLLGRTAPELGGGDWAADALGFNFYPDNQWIEGGSTIPLGHHEYRPLADMLVEAYERFGRPIFISETGSERSARSAWFHYVCEEVAEARSRGVAVEGVCIYPVTSFPGWDDSRHAEVGLFSTPHSDGTRRVDSRLNAELNRQRQRLEAEARA
ncbi:beta-glucosidase/6-phospho-beta-glucosidase/beta-galactosidase [Sphingomonas sp. F9_3S_D5_B_2]